jgi:AraC family transcriptional regulator
VRGVAAPVTLGLVGFTAHWTPKGRYEMDWIHGIQNAIRYIEDNITTELDYDEIAKQAYVSSFHFQRAFGIMCGLTLGEYIRYRRLTLAGMELSAGSAKVIDVAFKYAYDSSDSFARAFTRFHGISPSSARKEGANLKSFAPLRIKFGLEGGNVMEYRIEAKASFTVVGVIRDFDSDTSKAEIPKFWSEHLQSGHAERVCGMYGVCFENSYDSKMFKYMIADSYDGGEVPKGLETKEIPAATWAIFPCRGPMPDALQDVNERIWDEWIPNCREYEIAGNVGIEMYSEGDTSGADYYSEIWIPVAKI